MASPSFFQRKNAQPQARPAAAPPGDEAVSVQQARTQARRRLIGAVVLLLAGVIVFPLLFETQPRPLPGVVAIEMTPRESVDARARPDEGSAPSPAPREQTPATPPAAEPVAPASAVNATPTHAAPATAATETVAAPAAASAVPAAAASPEPVRSEGADKAQKPAKAEPNEKAEATEATRSAGKAVKGKSAAAEAAPAQEAPAGKEDDARARALLEGRANAAGSASAAAAAARFVVQVGAYSDSATLRQVRAKVEKLGLQTYIQNVQTKDGPRTRLRVGPFGSRQEAQQAFEKLAAAGLRGDLLTL